MSVSTSDERIKQKEREEKLWNTMGFWTLDGAGFLGGESH